MDVKDAAFDDAGIALGGTETGMTRKGLNMTDAGSVFKQIGRKCMPRAMD